MQEMKPCVWPGCNGEAVLGYFQKLDPLKVTVTKYHGKCLKCGMKGPEADTKETALAAWNSRDPWISVENELPGDGLSGTEDMSGVHVLISDGTGVSIGAFEWDECEWYCFGSVHVEVKWWQPLPPTPEGE